MCAHQPDDWADAVRIDETIRDFPAPGVAGLRAGGRLYVHASCRPLADVDLSGPHERQIDMFGNKCEGICGV